MGKPPHLLLSLHLALPLLFVFAFLLSSFAEGKGSAFVSYLAFAFDVDSSTSFSHALNPTKKALISTGSQRSGESRFSTAAADPPSSQDHDRKNLPHHPRHRNRSNPKPPSSPPPGLRAMPRQHRRHPTLHPASLPPRHPPPHPYCRGPLRHHPRPFQAPPLIVSSKIIRTEIRVRCLHSPNGCQSSSSSLLSGLVA